MGMAGGWKAGGMVAIVGVRGILEDNGKALGFFFLASGRASMCWSCGRERPWAWAWEIWTRTGRARFPLSRLSGLVGAISRGWLLVFSRGSEVAGMGGGHELWVLS
jgi:hypothetical protein